MFPIRLRGVGPETSSASGEFTGVSDTAAPGGFVNMDGPQRLAIANTGMCVPSSQALDDWLAGIPDVPGRDGLTRCGS
ncbi:MAG: hypothetical protein OXG38_01915 [Chloroflexi bacterium]|nr:hypothetical protein [Chloroflexota bacterium]